MSALAAFDFDGTLSERDSLLPFLARVAGRRRVATALAVDATAMREGRDAYKVAVLHRVLAGRPVDELREEGRTYAAELVRSGLRPGVRSRLDWHHEQGHEVVLVSASLDVYLDEVGRLLGLAHVYCSTLEVDATGACTGGLVGGNCRGERKAELLRGHLGGAERELWAYGDSSGDDAMLALARHGFRVSRRGALAPVGAAVGATGPVD